MKLYHLFEYNQAKTAQVFGNKLVTALATDRGAHFPTPLGTSREYLRQKDKIGAEPDEASKQLIVKDILNAIEQADPTPNKEYAQWLAKCYANEAQKLEDITSKGTDWLKKYHQFKVKKLLPDNLRNIANIKFSQLYDIVTNDELNAKLGAIENAPSKNKGQAETVLDNAEVRIIVPLDETGACYYGQGTQWCTAARNNNMFNRYNKDGRMYILLPKQPQYEGEKYQLHFPTGQYMDETDNAVNLVQLIGVRFSLVPFFKEREPALGNMILFADDAVLAPLLQRIGEMVMEKASDMLMEWEQSDNYYYQSLLDSGYGDEDGNIDWERVAEDDVESLSYDEGAREFYRDAEIAVNITPEEARNYASQIAEDNNDDEMLTLTELEKTVIKSVDDNMSEDEGGSTLKKYITDHVYITRDKESGQLTVQDLRNK